MKPASNLELQYNQAQKSNDVKGLNLFQLRLNAITSD